MVDLFFSGGRASIEPSGSTPITLQVGMVSFMYFAVPEIVPPVPVPATFIGKIWLIKQFFLLLKEKSYQYVYFTIALLVELWAGAFVMGERV